MAHRLLGSLAACAQSVLYGGFIPAGSVFGTLQAIGMTGVVPGVIALVGAVPGSVFFADAVAGV
jgi:hypothetical protein